MVKTHIKKSKSLGPSPPPKTEATRKTMKANRAKNTGPEIVLRRSLYEAGLTGYRLNWVGAPGRPDICYPGRKIAIFIHGCFWHRCPKCNLRLPKTHTDFWEKKFELNKRRDKKNNNELLNSGWKVIVFWECEIKKELPICISVVKTSFRK